jgi:hypothetical protein
MHVLPALTTNLKPGDQSLPQRVSSRKCGWKVTILSADGIWIAAESGDSVVRKCGLQIPRESLSIGMSCCRLVAGDTGGLGSKASNVALVMLSTGPSVARRVLGGATVGRSWTLSHA